MTDNKDKLAVLWTSGDPDVAEKMLFMYLRNVKKHEWFSQVVLIVWGPSSKLLSEHSKLQDQVMELQQMGVVVEACTSCAKMYDVVEDLEKLGIEVKAMGKPLTGYIKDGWNVMTM